jgi:hypothetical protein
MSFSRLLLVLAALGLASCAGREARPLFLDGQGGAQKVRPDGEGGFKLRRPIPAEGQAFYLRYQAGAGAAGQTAAQAGAEAAAVELRVLDPAGGVLGRRALPQVSPGADSAATSAAAAAAASPLPAVREVSLQVPLPPGSRVGGFALEAGEGLLPQVLEAGLTPPLAGFQREGGRLVLGTGVRSLVLPPGGGLQAELSSEPFTDGGWRIELEYELAGPEAARPGAADPEPGAQAAGPGAAGPAPLSPARARLEASAGGRRAAFEQEALAGARRLWLYPGLLGFSPARLTLAPLDGGRLEALRLEVLAPVPARAQDPAGPSLEPLPADPAAVLLYDPRFWRQPDYELFAWERFPGVLILDTADYAIQDRFFKRLAFFVEKEGFRGRLVSEQELSGRHGYNAHDYRAEDLAGFFAAAAAQGFPLNREEELLRAMLTANGLLSGAGAGQGAVLSISRESSRPLRELLLTHEAFHGLFFTLPRYRQACEQAWAELPDAERKFWRLFLDWGSYDYRDDYLAANEMQAYLFQQPRAGLDPYFRRLTAGRLERSFPGEASWLRGHLAGGGGGFEAAFDRLAPVLGSEAGLEGGRVLEWRRVGP